MLYVCSLIGVWSCPQWTAIVWNTSNIRLLACRHMPLQAEQAPTLTVAMTVKLNEPHGYSTLTVTMTVKLTEPQGCLTLTAIVAVKLRVCPMCTL